MVAMPVRRKEQKIRKASARRSATRRLGIGKLTFLSMLTGLGSGVTFGVYAALNAAFLGVTFFFVPETKGVSLEGIEAKQMAGKPFRHIGD